MSDMWKRVSSIGLSVVFLVSLLMSFPLISAAAPDKCEPWPECKGGGGEDPPADPAITYIRNGNPTDYLMVMDADGSNKYSVYRGKYLASPSWSPDGGQIAFYQEDENYVHALWRIDIDIVDGKPEGSNPVELWTDCEGCPLAWSPAGDVIAVVTGSYYFPPCELWTIPATGGSPTQLRSVPHGLGSPAWSPDGSEIAFVERWPPYGTPNPPPTVYSIKILTIASGEVRTVLETTDFSIVHRGLDWSRDGGKIAFVKGAPAIYTLDLVTGEQVFVTGGMYPTWSPDDSHLAYIYNTYVYSIDLGSGESDKLSRKSTWTPDWKR